MPYSKTHIGGLLEEGREGADKGREGGRDWSLGTRVVEGNERERERGRERKRKRERDER